MTKKCWKFFLFLSKKKKKKKCNERSQDKKVQQEMVNKQHVDVLGLTVEEVRGQKLAYLRLLYQQLHMPPLGQSKTHAKLPQTILFSANFLKCISPRDTDFFVSDAP